MPDLEPVQGKVTITSETAGVNEAESALGGFGDSLGSIMQIAAGFSLANIGMQIGQFVRDTTIGTIQTAANFDKLMHTIQGNTAMSDQDLGLMQKTVLDFSKQSGISTDELAKGFMHITNEGFSAKGAVDMLNASMKAAVDTGGSASDIANSLSVIMHNFGAKASEAGNYMNILMQIAAHGNLTLQDLAGNFQLVSSIASNAHVPIQQLGGMFDVLTKSTGDAARAQFEEERILTSILEPTKQAKTELESLSGAIGGSGGGVSKHFQEYSDAVQKSKNTLDSATLSLKEATKKYGDHSDQVQKLNDRIANINLSLKEHQTKLDGATTSTKALGTATGVDLVNDFTSAGLQAKGLTGVLEDVYKATGGNSEALKKLFPDQRAFIGIIALMKSNLKEYKDMVKQAGDATGTDLLNKEYQKRLSDFDVQWSRLTATMKVFAIEVGNSVLPQITKAISQINGSLNPAIKETTDLFNKQSPVLKDIWKQLQTLTGEVGHLFDAMFKSLKPQLKIFVEQDLPTLLKMLDLFLKALNGILSVTNALWDKWNNLPKGFKDFGSVGVGALLNMAGVPHFAMGTNSAPGGLAVVGERGPELVNLPSGSQVIPNGQGQGGGQGMTMINYNTFNTPYDVESFSRELGWRVSNIR